MDALDSKTFYTIVHIFGVVLGAGGAYMSDLLFLKSVKDLKISKTEMGFLRLGSGVVITGLFILFVSGVGLFLTDVDGYLSSSKFLAKMTIIGVIIVNGIVFHKSHLPRIKRHLEHHLSSSDEFLRKRTLLFASGAISGLSWTFALILGVFRSLPYSYLNIMFVYIIVISFAILTATLFGKKYILPHHKQR